MQMIELQNSLKFGNQVNMQIGFTYTFVNNYIQPISSANLFKNS